MGYEILACNDAPVTVRAPAKLNLGLKIGSRRADGFHEIRTTIVKLALADTLTFRFSGQFKFSCSEAALGGGDENLAVRAVDEFAAAVGWRERPALGVELVKRIPHGAGLGGGSSDAAAVLRFLNERTALFDRAGLEKIAASIGSDVPAFLHDGAVECRGRGDVVVRRGALPQLSVILAKPWFGIPTAWAYRRWSETVLHKPAPVRGCMDQAGGRLEFANDFETVAFDKYLVLPAARRWMEEREETRMAMMTGSGSALFAVLEDGACGEVLGRQFLEMFGKGWWTWTGGTLSGSA